MTHIFFHSLPCPEAVYSNSHATKTKKLEELYEITIGNVDPLKSASTNGKESSSISIAYGIPISVNSGGAVSSCSAWFIRNSDGPSESAQDIKTDYKDSHKRGKEKRTDGEESKSKKRKVREGKKSDVGALLSSLQGTY